METKNINDKIFISKIHNINEELKNIIYDDSIDFLGWRKMGYIYQK